MSLWCVRWLTSGVTFGKWLKRGWRAAVKPMKYGWWQETIKNFKLSTFQFKWESCGTVPCQVTFVIMVTIIKTLLTLSTKSRHSRVSFIVMAINMVVKHCWVYKKMCTLYGVCSSSFVTPCAFAFLESQRALFGADSPFFQPAVENKMHNMILKVPLFQKYFLFT